MCRTFSEGFIPWGKGLLCSVTTNPTNVGEENIRGSVQVEMDPNLAEFQCFVTSLLLQVSIHGLQQWISMPGPIAVSALWGLNPSPVQGLMLTDFSGVSSLLVLEETGKFTNVHGNQFVFLRDLLPGSGSPIISVAVLREGCFGGWCTANKTDK